MRSRPGEEVLRVVPALLAGQGDRLEHSRVSWTTQEGCGDEYAPVAGVNLRSDFETGRAA